MIYYIGHYASKKELCYRYAVASAVTKMDYVLAVLENSYGNIEILSRSFPIKKFEASNIIIQKCGNSSTLRFFSSLSSDNSVLKKIANKVSEYRLKKYCLKNIGKNDVVVLYHSSNDFKIIGLLKNLGCKVILEIEEIYTDVKYNQKIKIDEFKTINLADGYILAVESLRKILPQNRPYIVINGTYKTEVDKSVSFNDSKIHCIYAGTFDETKGGAAAAAAAAEFLPSNYHIHILGFGTEKQKNNLLALIDRVQKKAKCTLTYDGLKSGEEYITFLQKCHIGLCTQIPDAKYVETSFPSKILVYLANGLRVLSVRIPAVEKSDVGPLLNYYDKQTPEEIANAIMKIDINDNFNPREHLKKLDENCGKALKDLINVVQNENNR